MKLFKNPEVNKTLYLYMIISAAAIAAAYLWSLSFALFTLILCALFTVIELAHSHRRYKKIFELSADINHILHEDQNISLDSYCEGELAILQSEIYKMTIRLREQQGKLKKEKVYLADSIADISHQIRTPLTSINLLLGLLSKPNVSAEKRQQLTRELYHLLSRIDWLITALLKISKLDAKTVEFKQECILMEELIQKATLPIAILMELKQQTLTINANGNFTGDISWTCEAIVNIIKNCIEHTPNGGTIEINACDNPLFMEIIVSDNGNGIAKDDLPHVFERFYKGANSGETSFGIGLALSRMIIVEQNGVVKAENNAPNGAKFTIRLYKGTV